MRLFYAILLLISINATAQNLINFVPPSGYTKVLETTGDLDKDGIAETILVFNTHKKAERTGFLRELFICKKVNGVLKLWNKNSSVLWNSEDCGYCTDNGIDLSVVIKNNTIITQQTFWHNTRHTSKHRNIFRYQNNNWFLIGSTYNDRYNCGYDYTYDINFSTKQVNIKYDNEYCDDGTPEYPTTTKNFKYPFKSIPKMNGFTPGKMEVKIPNYDRYFYY